MKKILHRVNSIMLYYAKNRNRFRSQQKTLRTNSCPNAISLVYAIGSDFVDTFFRFYILYRLNSISSTQSGSGKRIKNGMSRSRRPGPFSLQSRIANFRHLCPEYRFFFSNTASCVKTLANPASQVLVTSLILQSRNLAFSRVPHYISVNPESREFSSGSIVLHSIYKCSL